MDFITPILLFLSSLAISADLFLFAGMLTQTTSIIALVIAGIATWRLLPIRQPQTRAPDEINLVAAIFFLLSSIAFFKILLAHPITIAVRTPWTALPPELFIAFGLIFLTAIVLKRTLCNIVAAFGYVSLTLLAFPLGYGFDSFLHRAAELAVVASGTINPLPILYGGQYGLIVALHHVTGIGIDALDRFLVPTLAAVILPLLAKRLTRSPLAALILLPLSLLTITTPFAFATLLFLIVVLVCASGTRSEQLRVGLPVALAATAVHVLAGLPALVVVVLSLLKHPKHLALVSFGGALIVPAALLAKIKLAGGNIAFQFPSDLIATLHSPLTTFRLNEDIAYLSGLVIIALFTFFLILGLRTKEKNRALTQCLAAALAFAISGVIISAFVIPDVIAYEQADYAKRLLLLSVLALSPFVMLGLDGFIARLESKSLNLRVAALVAITLLGVGHFYLLYPRADRHNTSKGFNVSEADLLTAKMVKADAGTKKYFILAPQTTSAAFVHELGFPSDDTTYPIPTGAPLYQYFLAMTEYRTEPQTIGAAMQYADKHLTYFILPKYWWLYDEIKQKTAGFATGSWDVNDQITVFKFQKN